MAVKVIIPTPLRVYAGKRDSAEFKRRDGRRSARRADQRNSAICASICSPKMASCAAS